MIDRGKKNILGVLINAVDYEAAVECVISAASRAQPLAVSALAVHGVMTGALNYPHLYRLNELDLVVPDGQPVRWALNFLHRCGLRDRVYGPTLTEKLLERASHQGLPVYFYGSRPEVLDKIRKNLAARMPKLRIAGMSASRFRTVTEPERIQIAAEIRASGARIVFVGLGCPRQEIWAWENRLDIGVPVIAVGAAFDFIAKSLPQAPSWMQRAGLEWLYRLVQEPRRLWRRYLLLNPLYVVMCCLQWLHLRNFDPAKAARPADRVRVG